MQRKGQPQGHLEEQEGLRPVGQVLPLETARLALEAERQLGVLEQGEQGEVLLPADDHAIAADATIVPPLPVL